MAYSIKEIAHLAGVSTRTIRYYDKTGLLKPARTGENGYRHYDSVSLLTLQQILFFRELDVPLKDIQEIIDALDFNLVDALQRHRKAIEKRAARMRELITTIDYTITLIKGKNKMAEKEIFNGFREEKYTEEVKKRWGKNEKYDESQRKWSSYFQAQKDTIKEEGGLITKRMVGADMGLSPDNPGMQAAIGDYLNEYFYTCDAEFLRELAGMWVTDARFALNYERIREGGAQFVRDAVNIFCDRKK